MTEIERINKYIKRGNVKKLREFSVFGKDKSIRLAAIDGLGKTAKDEPSVNRLVTLLSDHDVDIRSAAAAALKNTKSTYAQMRLTYFYQNEQTETVLQSSGLSPEKMNGEDYTDN